MIVRACSAIRLKKHAETDRKVSSTINQAGERRTFAKVTSELSQRFNCEIFIFILFFVGYVIAGCAIAFEIVRLAAFDLTTLRTAATFARLALMSN